MTDILGAYEVVVVAERIEENGTRFYSKQAQIAKDADAEKLFTALEKAEIGHRKKFHKMHAEFSKEEKKLKQFSGNQSAYLEALADENIFVLEELGDYSHINVQDAIAAAVQFEQASIDFYEAVEPVVEKRHRKTVAAIIEQEYEHKKALLNLAKHFLEK